jgi:hypothetical protein
MHPKLECLQESLKILGYHEKIENLDWTFYSTETASFMTWLVEALDQNNVNRCTSLTDHETSMYPV